MAVRPVSQLSRSIGPARLFGVRFKPLFDPLDDVLGDTVKNGRVQEIGIIQRSYAASLPRPVLD